MNIPEECVPTLMAQLAPHGEEYLTVAQVCERLSLGKSTIRCLMTSGKLREGEHYVRKGRKILCRWSRIESWLTQPPPPVGEHPKSDVIPFIRQGRRHG